MPGVLGTAPNQVPTVGDLGPLAFRDENPDGDIVGTSDVQVLSGKSFSDNVGIGTSSPVTALDVRTGTGASIIAGRTSNTGPASEPGNFEVRAPNASGTELIWNQINAVINTATAGSEASSMLFKTRSGGAFAERMRIDSAGNVGIGVTPSAWSGYGSSVIEMPTGGTLVAAGSVNIGSNWYSSGGTLLYKTSTHASYYQQNVGQHRWFTAPSGTAGSSISFTQAMTLSAGGGLMIGTSTDYGDRLHVSSAGAGDVISMRIAASQENGANGMARRIQWSLRGSTGSLINTNSIRSEWSDVGTNSAKLVFTSALNNSQSDAMTLDASGNLGLGVTPSAWGALKAIDIGSGASFAGHGTAGTPVAYMTANTYFNGTNWLYKGDDPALRFEVASNTGDQNFKWWIAPAGTAGATASFTQAMTLDASGKLGVGTNSPAYRLDVHGAVSIGSPTASGAAVQHFVRTGGGVTGDTSNGLTLAPGSNAATDQYIRFQTNTGVLTAAVGAASDAFRISTRDTASAVIVSQAGNLGLGVAPSAWNAGKNIETGRIGNFIYGATGSSTLAIGANAYQNSGWKYANSSSAAGMYDISGNVHSWFTAPSGTAGSTISFTQAMTLDANGNLTNTGSYANAQIHTLTVQTSSNYSPISVSGDRMCKGAGQYVPLILTCHDGSSVRLSNGLVQFSTGASERARIDTNGNAMIGRTGQSSGGKLEVGGNVVLQPAVVAPTLGTNGDMSFQLVSNTSLKILVRGSDGVTRSATLTLA